jgi:RimJ/RimL family protein N-acetyltransferase
MLFLNPGSIIERLIIHCYNRITDTKNKPTLYGGNIFLRPITVEDTDAILESTQDEESNKLTGTQTTFTREQIEIWCESLSTQEGRVDCAIVSKETGEYSILRNN